MHYFNTLFLEEATRFLDSLDSHIVRKVIYNLRLAEHTNDPTLFKKIHCHIWEFRTKSAGQEIRLLAFWDKSESTNTLVVVTNGFIKKTWKVSPIEIERALRIRDAYLNNKH